MPSTSSFEVARNSFPEGPLVSASNDRRDDGNHHGADNSSHVVIFRFQVGKAYVDQTSEPSCHDFLVPRTVGLKVTSAERQDSS